MSYFRDKNYFENDSKKYLVFEPLLQYINLDDDDGVPYNAIFSWESKGVSKELIKLPASNNGILSPIVEDISTKEKVKFNGSYLIQDRITDTPQTIVSIYIVYEITKNNPISNYPTLENCVFGAVKLTKNPDFDKYKYSGYGMGFDRRGQFSFGSRFGQNVIILGADMSSSVHAKNKTKKYFSSW